MPRRNLAVPEADIPGLGRELQTTSGLALRPTRAFAFRDVEECEQDSFHPALDSSQRIHCPVPVGNAPVRMVRKFKRPCVRGVRLAGIHDPLKNRLDFFARIKYEMV